MTTKNLVKAIAVAAGLAVGGNVYAQSKQPEVIATLESTYEYPSNRQDKNKGKIHTYNFLSDGTIYRLDNPKVKFSQRWFWDVDGDGKFGTAEEKAIKEGKIVYMHPKFNELASNETKKALENKVQNSGLTSNVKESILDGDYSQDLSRRTDKDEKPTTQSPIYPVNPSEEDAKKERREALKQIQNKESVLPEPEIYKSKDKSIAIAPILGINYSGIKNSAGIDAGLRLGNDDKLFNLAVLASYQKGFSGESNTKTTEVSPAGLYGKGISEKSDYQSFGFDVVGYFGKEIAKIILGAGYHWATETENKTAQILREDRILNSNNVSEKLSNGVFRGYMGFDFQTKFFRPEINFGLEKKTKETKPFVAIKTTFAPSNKYKRR